MPRLKCPNQSIPQQISSTPLLNSSNGDEEPLRIRRKMAALRLRSLRWATLISAALNSFVASLGLFLLILALRRCRRRVKAAVAAATIVALMRLGSMIGAGIAQSMTATAIAGAGESEDDDYRRVRRARYRSWLWWTRFGMTVTAMQFMVAFYTMYILLKDISYGGVGKACFLGQGEEHRAWKRILMISFLTLLWFAVIIQFVTGSDVLRWRSFYATHDTAWKAHYREVFDHGIREALCCMGRVKYLSVLEEDEVYSVARLLGDLVAYRASGTGHLELLAGLALLQRQKKSMKTHNDLVDAPEDLIQEAALFHRFSEAAYTGPLLDFGRNPVLFPCAWLHRQAVHTPWTRSRRPVLEGDNWWRGHAAAFLKCVNLPPEALLRGRVVQKKREAAYFIVVLHDLKSVVITVRGTETPEDLITDGLCRECNLSLDDLDGLINSDRPPLGVKDVVLSTFPHYGHSGIIGSARELFSQVDGHPGEKGDSLSGTPGFLSSLLGDGCECHGYKLIIVGHSLGGAVATLLGVRLYARYPNLHVYAYGPLPSVDSVIAEACSYFVTSIVYNDEFSSRLSVNSILRLRAASIAALSDDSTADSAIISRLARRIISKKYQKNGEIESLPPSTQLNSDTGTDGDHIHKRKPLTHSASGSMFLCGHAASCMMNTSDQCTSSTSVHGPVSEQPYSIQSTPFDYSELECVNGGSNAYNNSEFVNGSFYEYGGNTSKPTFLDSSDDLLSSKGQEPIFAVTAPSPREMSMLEVPEVFLAGHIIHIVPQERRISSYWKSWRADDRRRGYKAFVANRECFKDIVVSPYMFLDHLPWRCHYALQRVLESRKEQAQLYSDLFNGEELV